MDSEKAAGGAGSRPPPGTMERVFADLCDSIEGEKVTVGHILDALSHRSFGPLLLFPSVIAVLPVVGALPGVSMGMAALAFLVSIHFMVNRRTLWLPRRVRCVSMSSAKFKKWVGWSMPTFRRIDKLLHRRFGMMLRSPWPFLISLLCVLLSVAMGIGALVPGGIVPPALALAVVALGLTAHDGLVLASGLLVAAVGLLGLYVLVF